MEVLPDHQPTECYGCEHLWIWTGEIYGDIHEYQCKANRDLEIFTAFDQPPPDQCPKRRNCDHEWEGHFADLLPISLTEVVGLCTKCRRLFHMQTALFDVK